MINQFIKYIINFYSSPSYFKNYFRILYKYIDIYFNFFNNFLIKRYNIHQIFQYYKYYRTRKHKRII